MADLREAWILQKTPENTRRRLEETGRRLKTKEERKTRRQTRQEKRGRLLRRMGESYELVGTLG